MHIKNITLCLAWLLLSLTATAQVKPAGPEEYAYYRNGKKVALLPQPDEVFVTFSDKVDLSRAKTYASGLRNGLAPQKESDVFAPMKGVHYRLNTRGVAAANTLQTFTQQLAGNPDVVTVYPAFTGGNEKVYVGNQVAFALKKGTDSGPARALVTKHKASVTEEIDLGDKIIFVATVPKGKSVFELANGLYESGLVEFAEPDFVFEGHSDFEPNDDEFANQWHLNQNSDADIDAPEAWEITKGALAVVVAVIDGHGFELKHSDMMGKIVNPYNAANDDNSPLPQNEYANHGTNCLGMVTTATNNGIGIAGIGYGISVMPVSVGTSVDSNGVYQTSSTILARAAARIIATPNVVAVSNSYDFSSNMAATREASYSSMRYKSRGGLGAVVLAATGNSNIKSPNVFPAGYHYVVGVGASTIYDTKAPFSNYGTGTDIVAPGSGVLTIDRLGSAGSSPTDYYSFVGTSAACPMAAGVVGLVASVNLNVNADHYIMALLSTADKVGGYTYQQLMNMPYGTWSNEMGHGRLNAFKTLQFMLGPPVITAFEPIGGPAGTYVKITGQNFLGATKVTFNGVNAQFLGFGANTIYATVPAGATTGAIRITTAGGTGTSNASWIVTDYCLPNYENPCSSNNYVNNFSIHTLVNNGSGCNGARGNYVNYPAEGTTTTQLLRGRSYPLTVQGAPFLSEAFGVWIDYNDDGDFKDAGEFVYSSPTPGKNAFTGTITIPDNTSTGRRRLRVRSRYYALLTANDACTTFPVGETEDYTVTIGYCEPLLNNAQDYIDSFSFNTLVNNATGSNPNKRRNGYINFPATGTTTTTVSPGQTYPIKVQTTSYAQGFGAWIDYNNDQDFNDAGEFVYAAPAVGTVASGNVTIPATATPGQRRLRVMSKHNALVTASESCLNYNYGETEDYTITIGGTTTPTSQWNKRYGGSGSDNFSRVIRTPDGGYLAGGYSSSSLSGDRSESSRGGIDYWIVKTDGQGNKQWDKRYGGAGDDYLNALTATADGGYLLAGTSFSGVGGDKSQGSQGSGDYWLVKISASGTKLWDKRFGGAAHDDLRTVQQLSTGEYVVAGYSASGLSGDKTQSSQGGQDYWLVKISSSGTKLWDKRFGGSADDVPEALLATPDGGLLLAGRSASGLSGDRSQGSQGGRDYWVVKVNASGAKLWDKRLGGTGNDEAYSLVAAGDGNYLLGGYSSSPLSGDKTQSSQGGSDFWVVKLTSSGSKLWDKRYGGSLTEELRSLVRTPDGGFLLGGKSNSGTGGDKSQSSRGGHDYWVVRISAGGTKLWDKRFGGSLAEELRTVLTTSDGGFLLGGRSDSGQGGDKTQSSRGSTDYWLVKLSASGGATVAAAEAQKMVLADSPVLVDTVALPQARIATGPAAPENESVRLHSYPNPFTDVLTVELTLPRAGAVKAGVYDSQGNLVKSFFEGQAEAGRTYRFTWRPGPQKAGLYLIRVVAAGAVTHGKVVFVK